MFSLHEICPSLYTYIMWHVPYKCVTRVIYIQPIYCGVLYQVWWCFYSCLIWWIISDTVRVLCQDMWCLVTTVSLNGPGAHFTNDFLPAIQIRWKLRVAVIPLLASRSHQIFAHATTAQLSCHVQNFVVITVLESRWKWNEISIEFELWWKNREWNGVQESGLQYRISRGDASPTRILHNLICPQLIYQLPNHFEILRRARQWYCCALYKISKHFVK